MERKEVEETVIAENGKIEATPQKDGSICGFDSLHHLLQASLNPQLFQVTLIKIHFFFVESMYMHGMDPLCENFSLNCIYI